MPKRVLSQWPDATKDNPSGVPQPCRIAIVGEYVGMDEEWLGVPFVGASGIELSSMLEAAGINRAECFLTNVIMERPPENNLAAFCIRKEDLPDGYPTYLGPIISGSGGNFYLAPDRFHEGARLRAELAIAAPNVIISLGSAACWALLGRTDITSVRGTVARSITSTPYKVVPTWNPAGVLREYTKRPVSIADMVKAKAESLTPDLKYDNAELWLQPSLDDLYEFERRYVRPGQLHSVDIETAQGEITCIGVAPTPERAIVIPFRTNPQKFRVAKGNSNITVFRPTGNYWPTAYEEKQAWMWVKRLLERDDCEIVGQNFMYDLAYLIRYGIRPRRFIHDTMLMHHSLYPELPKDLGFLGSIYANYPSWKLMAGRHAEELKKDA